MGTLLKFLRSEFGALGLGNLGLLMRRRGANGGASGIGSMVIGTNFTVG